MNEQELEQYNNMLHALWTISEQYMSIEEIAEESGGSGLEYAEFLEMAYDNIQGLAKSVIAGHEYPYVRKD